MVDVMPLRTLAVDFNSFFASCEQQENPRLRGKPVAVLPVMTDSSCVIAASYPAKARGVKTGTGVREAKKLCPELHLVESRPGVYIDYHHRLLEVIESCIHITTVRSIDEMECDLTKTFAPRAKALSVAREIKRRIKSKIGASMTSSIGIAPNWMLAKLATNMQKPDGLVVVEQEELPERLLGLKIDDFNGIGDRMKARLEEKGFDSVKRLYGATRSQLKGVWGGVEGERMYARLRGDQVPLHMQKHKTVGHSHVLPPKLRSTAQADAVIHRLMQKAAMRLRNIAHYAGAMSAYISYLDGQSWSEEIRFAETQDTLRLTLALTQLLSKRPATRQRPAQVGITLIRLLPMSSFTPDLFEQPVQEARERLNHAMDTLNHTFGNGSVFLGGAFGVTDNAPMRISFTCIPKPELEEIDPTRKRRLRP